MPIEHILSCEPNFEIEMRGIDKKKRTLSTNLYFLDYIFKRINKGFSPLIVICGSQRIGKSFIGIWLCYLMNMLLGKKYDPENNTFYKPIEAIKGLENKFKDSLLIDEAGDVLDAREWYEQTHQALKSIINTQAYKTMMYIFISPFVIDIDKAFRKHFDFMIRVHGKGKFKVFRYVKKYDATNDNKVVTRVFLDECIINLNDVPKDIWKRYLSFSIEEKEKIRQRRVDKVESKIYNTKEHKKFGVGYGINI